MKRTLLPLNALRVLDAAARHLSFTKAADELAVTPAAVGQQIRALEETLGTILFRRTTRGLELTPEAEAALPSLRDGFALFEQSVRTLQANQAAAVLTVAVARSAEGWLGPRLAAHLAARPDLRVRLLPLDGPVDFAQANLDLALHWGAPPDAEGVHGRRIADEALVTVAAPHAPDAAIHCPEAGLPPADAPAAPPRLAVAHAGLALGAALAGLGRARVPLTLAAPHLAAGALEPHGAPEPIAQAFWLCAPVPQWRQAKVRALVEALLSAGA